MTMVSQTQSLGDSNTKDSSYDSDDDSIALTTPHITRQEIEALLGMRPKNLDYYRRALVHKSVQSTVRKSQQKVLDYLLKSNERLEYLGDSVLGLIVAHYLFDKFPTKDEGFMTRTKTKIVCGPNCAKLAREIGLGQYILMSKHVERINGKKNEKLLEDAFEAFIGAVYKDLGFKFAQVFVCRLIDRHLDFKEILEDNNYKDILLRYSQAKCYPLPEYKVTKEEGPPHKRVFTVMAYINNNPCGVGTAKSKKAAEQKAAQKTLETIDTQELEGIINRDCS